MKNVTLTLTVDDLQEIKQALDSHSNKIVAGIVLERVVAGDFDADFNRYFIKQAKAYKALEAKIVDAIEANK